MREIKCSLSTFGFQMLPAPVVQAYCYVPRLNLGREVDFLIDTGAAGTCLNGGYAYGLQNHMRSNSLSPICGIGGTRQYYQERALLLFRDSKGQPVPQVITLGIQQLLAPNIAQDPDLLRMPCLLGRDILNRWELRYDARKSNITLRVP